MGGSLGIAALITWFAAVLAGLYMLAVWLIENDATSGTAPSRLPPPVLFTHLFLAATGLLVWVAYLSLHRTALAWAACGVLLSIAALGLTMFARWIPVYRGPTDTPGRAGRPGRAGPPGRAAYEIPAEGHFPVVLVVCHGLLAVTTLILVLLTTLGVGR